MSNKIALVTLNIGNFEPELTAITYPRFKAWAHKIGADFIEITEKRINGPTTICEKFQIPEVSKNYEWTYFLDADALISVNTPPWHEMVGRDTVLFNGTDFFMRWQMDHYFRRHREWQKSACTWNVVCSEWTRDDLWRVPEEGWEAAIEKITVLTIENLKSAASLLDDYLLSRNIARYGLHVETIIKICAQFNVGNSWYWHAYNVPSEQKLKGMLEAAKTI